MMSKAMVGDYVVIKQIGAGSFSTVWLARHRVDGTEVAIKEVLKSRLDAKLWGSLKSEISILKKINHPNIVRLHDLIEESEKIYIVLECCKGGDLSMYIKKRHGKIPEATVKHFMQQLAQGLKVLHKNNLIHRDLKPQNLLLSTNNDDENSVLKIADFGFARSLQHIGVAETYCGSPLYMAPEIMKAEKYDAKADLWSVGTILFQLVTGEPPYTGASPWQLQKNILNSRELQFPPKAKDLDPHCLDLCRKLLRKNPVERLTFGEFFDHPYFSNRQHDESFRYKSLYRFSVDSKHDQEDKIKLANPRDVCHLHKTQIDVPKVGMHKLLEENIEVSANATGLGSLENNPKVVDSLDSIDQDYVIVGPLSPLDSLSSLPAASSKPNHLLSKTNSATLDSRNTNRTNANFVFEKPSVDCTTRMKSLQLCAYSLRNLVREKTKGGEQLEAFSVQLIILAMWKQQLHICRTQVASVNEGLPSQHAARSGEIERVFLREVENAEKLAKVIAPGNVEMPDAMEVIYQYALALGRRGAVEEYMGNVDNAVLFYSTAVRLLQFLITEAPFLVLNPPFSLTSWDRCRVKHYIEDLSNRQSISESRQIALAKAKDQPGLS